MRRLMGMALSLALLLAACGGQGSSTSPGASGSTGPSATPPLAADQVMHADLGTEPPSQDPTQATDSASIAVLRQTTATLVFYDQQLNVIPWLAKSWDISPDGTQITFHLRDNIKYSNGDPIVAGDFVFSWKRLIDPRNAAGYSYIMADVKGGSELLSVDTKTTSDADINAMLDKFGVAAPDDKTFVVTLAHPAAYFVYIATLYGTVPLEKKWVETKDFTEAANWVGSGPMTMTEWTHNSKIVLKPNPNWNPAIGDALGVGAPTIAEIDYTMITDPTAVLAAYEANEEDTALVPSQEVSRVQSDPTLSQQVVSGATLSITYFGFDVKQAKSPFTKSVKLRQAFNEAIDKKTMMATAFAGIGVVADSMVPPGMPGHQDTVFYPFDKAKAKADFDAALAELNMKPADLKLQIGYNTGANWENKIDYMVEAWRDAFGISVEAVGLEWGSYLDRLGSDPFSIFRLGWGADYPHPNNFLTDLFSCTSANNYMGYCNKDLDNLLAQAAQKASLDEQIPLYNQAQEMIMADAPIIPVRFGQRFTVVKPWVTNLRPTAQDNQNTGDNYYAWVSIAAH